MANSKYEYVKKFEADDRLPLYNWIIVRIDGCHFHRCLESHEQVTQEFHSVQRELEWLFKMERAILEAANSIKAWSLNKELSELRYFCRERIKYRFSAIHKFDKPNDANALDLMNSCAVSMLEHFPDIVFAYGVSDEYSFILKERTQLYQRRASKIVSLSVSYFTALYVMKWKEFFPHKELKEPPSFDGRVVCYPRVKFIRDYLSWRQVDCHINNQYNTCFWMLVKSGKTESEAQEFLKGTQTKEKNELLFQQFGINYDKLPAMFRKGSCVYRDKVEEIVKADENGDPIRRTRMKVFVGHFDVIGPKFWSDHPYILEETN